MGDDIISTRAVVFDIDGTLLDSAPGIVAGFQHALRSVGVTPPSETELRSDLGPELRAHLATLGVAPAVLPQAIAAYRSYYLQFGIQRAVAYAGVVELLESLRGSVLLGTATAKRTDTGEAILALHRLAGQFQVVNGTDDLRTTKPETIAYTLERLRLLTGETLSPAEVVMVGDRHSDISGGQSCGVRTVGVSWGYGSRAELAAAAPDAVIDHPGELLDLLGC